MIAPMNNPSKPISPVTLVTWCQNSGMIERAEGRVSVKVS